MCAGRETARRTCVPSPWRPAPNVLYDRHAKRVTAGLAAAHTVAGRGFDEPDHMAGAVGVQ